MRYSDGGGLTEQGRAKREAVRRQAAGWFAEEVPVPEVARRLRVSQTAVYGWRQRWRAGGEQALASKGASGSRVVWTIPGSSAWLTRWTLGRPCTASGRISGGLLPGCRT
jgi:hypothetical protein